MARSRFMFDDLEAYMATAYSVRDRLIEEWNDTQCVGWAGWLAGCVSGLALGGLARPQGSAAAVFWLLGLGACAAPGTRSTCPCPNPNCPRRTYIKEQDPKRVYYLSMEFLMGRSLLNALNNLEVVDQYKEAIEELGYKLETLVRGMGGWWGGPLLCVL